MEQTDIVILSGQSLFAKGIASRLQQCLKLIKLEIMVPGQFDVMSQVIAAQPSVVILDDTDPGIEQKISWGQWPRKQASRQGWSKGD